MAALSKMYPLPDPAAVSAKIAAAGGPVLDADDKLGQATVQGVTIGWAIAAGSVTVTILHKPALVPQEMVWKRVDALFE